MGTLARHCTVSVRGRNPCDQLPCERETIAYLSASWRAKGQAASAVDQSEHGGKAGVASGDTRESTRKGILLTDRSREFVLTLHLYQSMQLTRQPLPV